MEFRYAERLSALDASFLQLETPNAHMHVGAVALFEAAPLCAADGSIDLDCVFRTIVISHFGIVIKRYGNVITGVSGS